MLLVPRTGPAVLLDREDDIITQEMREQVWRASEEAVGERFDP